MHAGFQFWIGGEWGSIGYNAYFDGGGAASAELHFFIDGRGGRGEGGVLCLFRGLS
jgi:hypothetical protein